MYHLYPSKNLAGTLTKELKLLISLCLSDRRERLGSSIVMCFLRHFRTMLSQETLVGYTGLTLTPYRR